MKLISATANQHKYKEMQQILSGKIELLPRPPEIPEIIEDAPDLQGNAHLKAQGIMEATGKPAIADDTGLEVEALNGEPESSPLDMQVLMQDQRTTSKNY